MGMMREQLILSRDPAGAENTTQFPPSEPDAAAPMLDKGLLESRTPDMEGVSNVRFFPQDEAWMA